MAGRIRSIKPEILEDEKTAALSHLAWRLFVSLWLIADDFGNLRGDPVYVLGQTLWATNETRKTIDGALNEMAAIGLIVRYRVRGQSYCHIAGWAKHQKVTHIGKPRVPGPNESDPELPRDAETVPPVSANPPETFTPDLRPQITDRRSSTEESLPRAIPQSVPQVEQVSVADRKSVREQLRADLEAARERAGISRGVAIKPLLAFDRGIDVDLVEQISRADTPASLAKLADQAKHAIAMAELEVIHGHKSFEWFTGAVFSGGNFSRLVGMTEDDAKRSRSPPSRKSAKPPNTGRFEPMPSDQYTESGDQKI